MAESDPGSQAFQPGEQFLQSRFEVVRFLGEGGSGQVYVVRHCDTGDHFALKVMHLADRGEAKKVERNLAAAKATYQLKHRNIVYVHDLGCEDDGLVWMRMDLLDGVSLGDRIHRFGFFTPLHAIDIALSVCWALQAAHEQEVIHRDINPSNVLITRAGEVKVLDFSMAKVIRSPLQTTFGRRSMGTMGYMAPEYLKGGEVTVQFDVYTVGLLLWEMMVGRHPFASPGVELQEQVRRQLNEELPSLAAAVQLPPYVDEVILRATALDPRQRYGSIWALGQGLLELRARLASDPAAMARVRPTHLEREHPLLLDGTGQQRYQAPRSLPGPVTAPPMPSQRVVVAKEVGSGVVVAGGGVTGAGALAKTEAAGAIEAARGRMTPVAAGPSGGGLAKTEPMGAIEAARARVTPVAGVAGGGGVAKTEAMGAIEAARGRMTPATIVDAGGGAGGQRGSGIGGQGSSGVLLAGPAGGAGRGVTEIGGAAPTVRSGGKKVAGWVWGVVAVVVVGAIAVVVAVIAGVMRGAG